MNSSEDSVILFVSLGILALFFIVFLIVRSESKRRKGLAAWGELNGWQAEARPLFAAAQSFAAPDSAAAEVSNFILSHGLWLNPMLKSHAARGKITLALRRKVRDGFESAFEFTYTTGHGKNRSTHVWSFFLRQSPDRPPRVPIHAFFRPEGIWDKLEKLFGGADLNFEDDPEFSKAYRVFMIDERVAAEFLSSSRRAELLEPPRMSFEITPGFTLFCQQGKLSEDRLEGFLNQCAVRDVEWRR